MPDATWVFRRLTEHFGAPQFGDRAPLRTLILTILSQNTTDVNRDRAYASLWSRFGSFEAVADAEAADVASAIRAGGLQRQKASSIQAVLRRLRDERGRLDLGFLASMPTDEALGWLLASRGVGKKTAGIVLLFAFDRPVFPVDTHIRRVSTRLGWIGRGDDPHRTMNAILPKDVPLMAGLHLLLIELGRKLCHPRRPECPLCPLESHCPTGAAQRRALS